MPIKGSKGGASAIGFGQDIAGGGGSDLFSDAAAWGGTFAGSVSGCTTNDTSSPSGGFNYWINSSTGRNRSAGGSWIIGLTNTSQARYFGILTQGTTTGRPSPTFDGGQGAIWIWYENAGRYYVQGYSDSSQGNMFIDTNNGDTVPSSGILVGISFNDPSNDYMGIWDTSGNAVGFASWPTTATSYYPHSCTFDGVPSCWDLNPTIPTLGTTLGTYTANNWNATLP